MNEEQFLRRVGNRIRDLRMAKKLSQEDMDSGDFAIPVTTFQEIEYGNRNFTMQTLFKISKRLGVEPRDLLDY